MAGAGVMRAVAKVAGFGIFNTSLRGGVQVTPPSAEHSVMRFVSPRSASSSITVSSEGVSPVAETTASGNHKVSSEMVNDCKVAGSVEEEVAPEGSTTVSGGREPMARVVFGGVPSLEETKEATADLKDVVDKFFLSSPKSSDTAARASVLSLFSNPEETKDCVAFHFKSEPVFQAFRLLHESSVVQSVVESLAADPNLYNAALNNPAFKEFIQSQETNDEFKHQRFTRSSKSSVNLEDFFDASQLKDGGSPFSVFLQNIKNCVFGMVNKATDFLQSLFGLPFAEKGNENGGSNIFEKTTGASIMGLVITVIMIVLLKRV